MAARLKVFTADIDGLHQWIVAAPNQAEALKAWGVHQNLFAQGLAKVISDADAVAAATAAPGEALRRPAGTKKPFEKPTAEGDASGWAAAAKAAGVKRPKAAARKRDRTALDAAEAALDRFETETRHRRDDIARRREALEKEEAALDERVSDARQRLEAELKDARRAFER
jgi:hypothetical protein